MDELFKAASRFCLAEALFVARQLGGAFSPDERQRAAGAFDSVTGATEVRLDGALGRAFRAGDRLQRGLCDFTADVLRPSSFTSRGMMWAMLNAVSQTAGVIGRLAPGPEARAGWLEFQNKLEAFSLFEHADSVLGLPRGADVPLAELVRRAHELDPFLSVWATEGVGHFYAESAWESGREPDGLLRRAVARGVAESGLAALHAGAGLSLAARLLATVREPCDECAADCELRRALARFVELCRRNSEEEYAGAACEGLGLVARNLYPHLVPCIDLHLPAVGEHLLDYFWHGVGRAIYFAPTNYMPWGNAARRAVEMSRREPPHELGRRNALAGVAWALLLVNLRHPEVLEVLMSQCDDGELDGDAFANGVASAAIIWRDSAGGDPHLDALRRYRPAPSGLRSDGRWQELVLAPCRRALDEYYDVLKRRGLLGEVFRYQSLPELMAKSGGARGL